MSKYISRVAAPLALSLALFLGACSEKKSDDTLAQDTSLNRDLQMANQDTTAQPALQDVPSTTTPVTTPSTRAPVTRAPARSTPSRTTTTTKPAPKPSTPTTTASGNTVTKGSSGSERSTGSIPAGSEINLTSNSRV